jgi:hypothetical protein
VILDYTENNLHKSEHLDFFKPAYNVIKIAGFRTGIKRNAMSDEQKKKGIEHHRYGIKHSERELILIRDNHPKTKIVDLADKITLVGK